MLINFVLGGMASVTAEMITFPIDMAKTRLQIQGQIKSQKTSNVKYRGMIHTIKSVACEEGFKSLYSGLSAAVLRQASYGTFKIGLYENIKDKLYKDDTSHNLLYNTLNGGFSGAISTIICSPTDMLKIRFQSHNDSVGGAKRFKLFNAFLSIYRNEGFFGLYRGAIPNAERAAVVTGVELASYDFIKHQILALEIVDDNPICHLLCSSIAGFLGAVFSNPFDVVKSRIMNQVKNKNSVPCGVIYKNTIDCFRSTIQNEGFSALYKGFIPSVGRLVPWNIMFFLSLEQYRNAANYWRS